MNLETVYVTKNFHGLFSAFLFFKKNRLHMHLGPNNFFFEFLKSSKLFTNLIFSGSEFHTCGPSVLRLLLPKALVLYLSTNKFCFYDLYMEIDKLFFS